jgi:hypothetical protein
VDPANRPKVDLTLTLPEDLKGFVCRLQLAIFNAAAPADGRRRDGLLPLKRHVVLMLMFLSGIVIERRKDVVKEGGRLQNDDQGHSYMSSDPKRVVKI